MKSLGYMLIVLGSVLILAGGLWLLVERLPWLGRLPGDIHWEGPESTVHFPVATCLLVSLLATLLLNIILRLFFGGGR